MTPDPYSRAEMIRQSKARLVFFEGRIEEKPYKLLFEMEAEHLAHLQERDGFDA